VKLGKPLVRCCLVLGLCLGTSIGAKENELLRLPGAILLLGYGPTDLQITTPTGTIKLQPTGNEPASWEHHTHPSLSRDGKLVATARLKAPGREVIATYLIPEKKWIEYSEVYNLWSVSISADGSKVAFVGQEKGELPLLKVLDTRTRISVVAVPSPVSVYAAPSWSPDGYRIAYQVDSPRREALDRPQRSIDVVDIRTGKISRLASGQNPSWSPSGEWIAYLDTSGNPGGGTRCLAVRPDGNGYEGLSSFNSRSFGSERTICSCACLVARLDRTVAE
jgi:dipeptidyl aminopeptidase/acylaminoacyl peptidase